MRDLQPRSRGAGTLGLRLAILILLALLLFALQISGQLRGVQGFIVQLTSPAQVSTTGVTDWAVENAQFVLDLRTLRQRVAELEERNAALEAEIFRLSEVETRNVQLLELLDFAQTRPALNLRGGEIRARVIGFEGNNFLDYLRIDLGSADGIEVGMPVVTEQGLVGRIDSVTSDTANVLLIRDPESSVNAITLNNRVTGLMRGAPSGNLVLDLVRQGAPLAAGDRVLTSGIASGETPRFPRGIPIGQIVSVDRSDNETFQRAVVQPIVNFDRLEIVAVITNFDPLEPVPQLEEPPAGNPVDVGEDITSTQGLTATGTISEVVGE